MCENESVYTRIHCFSACSRTRKNPQRKFPFSLIQKESQVAVTFGGSAGFFSSKEVQTTSFDAEIFGDWFPCTFKKICNETPIMITVPGWNMDDDFMRPDNELVELVWQNGHVVLHSQTRETTGSVDEHRETYKDDAPSKNGGRLERYPNNFNQQDETASWMQYPLDDSLTKDFCFDFFYGMPTSESIGMDKLEKDNILGDGCIKFGFNEDTNVFTNSLPKQSSGLHIEENTMPPPNSQTIGSTMPQASSAETSGFVNFSHFTIPVKIDTEMYRHPNEKDTRNAIQREVGKPSSMVSKLSGNLGSDQIQKQPDLGHSLSSGVLSAFPKQEGVVRKKIRKRCQTETHDTTTGTSSSGGSGSSVGRTGQQITSSQSHKRKRRHVEESESHSEEAENQSREVERRPQRSTSTRRSRAAEVHNQSERRRRDRINEKMKALQELIPHCNKTDKASMLDEAIEYLKSLQLQVQIMWMGSGMAPMVFPNHQQYMSLMGRAMGQGSIPSIPGSSQMPSVPMPNQSVPSVATTKQAATVRSQILKSVNFPNQMQNSNISDAYVRHLGFHNMQPPSQANQ